MSWHILPLVFLLGAMANGEVVGDHKVGGCSVEGVTCQHSHVLTAKAVADADTCLDVCQKRRHCAAYTFYPPETEGSAGACLLVRHCRRPSTSGGCRRCISGDANACPLSGDCFFRGKQRR